MSDLEERARDRVIALAGHFTSPVRVETVEDIGADMLLVRVRTAAGLPHETTVAAADLEAAIAEVSPASSSVAAAQLFRWVESHRIRLAYAHDPYFAVSLSGVRGLPHQIEAVYRHLLPQSRLRFVLADDPGAGKTIMAGLLLKELKLRGVVDRTLVVAPAPLTVQWQDELFDKFDERFEVVSGAQVKWQLGGNPWQHYPQVVTSLDFAKRDDVIDDLLRADWDLVIVDEAHKCAAATYGDEVRKTRRYVLAEALAARAERLLLLTATPHSGDQDRFVHFLSLLDPDQFSSAELVRQQLSATDSPYFLRSQKEDLVDEDRRQAVRPAPGAHPALRPHRRREAPLRRGDRLHRRLPGRPSAGERRPGPGQRGGVGPHGAAATPGVQLGGDPVVTGQESRAPHRPGRRSGEDDSGGLGQPSGGDDELDLDDADEEAEERAATEVTAAAHIDGLRAEVAALKGLTAQADATMATGEEAKLTALRSCLARSELAELADGRAKLLIFTEHRDTLNYLERHLGEWGYSVCTIHGGHPPATRKAIQHEFRTSAQVCIATEAAGEGINLQFCHLMVNYDLPWNPVRLEQRMGRIHRIGQSSDVVVFNFCATNTVEGRLLARLHEKLDALAYVPGARIVDGRLEVADPSAIRIGTLLPLGEMDLSDTTALVTPEEAVRLTPVSVGGDPETPGAPSADGGPGLAGPLPAPSKSPSGPVEGPAPSDTVGVAALRLRLDGRGLFPLNQALTWLRENGQSLDVEVTVRATAGPEGFDRLRLRNGVLEPLEEGHVDVHTELS